MKAIRNITILFGLSLVLLALGATGARAQVVEHALYSGTFTLPFDAQWGTMILPAGDYSLYYGHLGSGGTYMVEVAGKKLASPHGFVLPTPTGERVSRSENTLICIREGNKSYIRELRMGFIGESARFAIPHGVVVRARIVKQAKHNANAPHAEARLSIVHVPVK